MKFRLLLVFLLLVKLPQVVAAGTILIVGDSLSAAYGLPVEKGWVNLLQEQLAAKDYACEVVNASISGDTTASGRERLAPALRSHTPSVVVLELGGNDGLRGLSLSAMRDNLAAMIESAQQAHARVLLIGVQLPPNYGPLYNRRFEAVFSDLAETYGVALLPSIVDGVGTRSDLMQADGIHPNEKAQPLIARSVWQQLKPLLDAGATPVKRRL